MAHFLIAYFFVIDESRERILSVVAVKTAGAVNNLSPVRMRLKLIDLRKTTNYLKPLQFVFTVALEPICVVDV
jgi:hypothetical protein